ncbi:MAG: D-alanine--D-alanine ligase family protein, partial [Thermodesulfobacteriota bacterium]
LIISKDTFLSPSLNPQKPIFYEIMNDKVTNEYGVDVIFPVLHGTFGEDGTVQGLFKLLGIPFVGASVLGSSVGMDKIIMKSIFREYGLPVVNFNGFYKHEWNSERDKIKDKIIKEITIPCFVKSADLGSSIGITRVNSKSDLEKAIEFASSFSERVIIEKAVLNAREIEISVLGNENPIASLPGEIIPHREFYDYTAKYIEDSTELIAPATIDNETQSKLQECAIKAFKAINCSGMGRVDFLLERDSDAFFISEVNTIPGFTHISMYPKLWELSGLGYQKLISRLIDLAFERHEKIRQLKTDIKNQPKI